MDNAWDASMAHVSRRACKGDGLWAPQLSIFDMTAVAGSYW
jgi:hypothetical protein